MDQVIFLMNEYLTLLPDDRQEEKQVTPAMINNYVKLKIIPPPVKKRYSRVHLAYLVMVCVLKLTMNTAEIKKLLPADLPEETVKDIYAAFGHATQDIKGGFCQSVRAMAQPVLEQDGPPVTWLIFRTAVAANLFKQATQQLVSLRQEANKKPTLESESTSSL
ncbi:MAG: DUF1836 domain-containing protein [Clostridia bacterium]|nr:DUF1836 domain-containing protein [Clostridia bacterium]